MIARDEGTTEIKRLNEMEGTVKRGTNIVPDATDRTTSTPQAQRILLKSRLAYRLRCLREDERGSTKSSNRPTFLRNEAVERADPAFSLLILAMVERDSTKSSIRPAFIQSYSTADNCNRHIHMTQVATTRGISRRFCPHDLAVT